MSIDITRRVAVFGVSNIPKSAHAAQTTSDVDVHQLTLRDASAVKIPPNVLTLQTTGYHKAADGGAAHYRRVNVEPSHTGKFKSTDGGWWEIADEEISGKQLGLQLDGVALEAADVEAAVRTAGILGRRLRFSPKDIAKIERGLKLPVHDVDWGGMTIDASQIESGVAVSLVPAQDSSNKRLDTWRGLRLLGPDTKATAGSGDTAVDGLLIEGRPAGATTGNTAFTAFYDLVIVGFRDGLIFGNSTWLNKFYNFRIAKCNRTGINFGTARAEAGENLSFFGGDIEDCRNRHGTAVCAYFPDGCYANVFFYATSFDYSDLLIVHHGGQCYLTGSHFENNSQNPMIKVQVSPGRGPVLLEATSCNWVQGPLGQSGTTEAENGRKCLVEVSNGWSEVIIRGGAWQRGGKASTEFVAVTGNATPRVRIDGLDLQVGPGTTAKLPSLGSYLSLIPKRSFSTAPNAWRAEGAVNFVRNGSYAGGESPQVLPADFRIYGATNGTLQWSVRYDSTSGKPTMFLRLRGIPSSDGAFGFYLLPGLGLDVAEYQQFELRSYVRATSPSRETFGVGGKIEAHDRSSAVVAESVAAHKPTPDRRKFEVSPLSVPPTARTLQAAIYINFFKGKELDAELAIDTPTLTLTNAALDEQICANPAADWPAARHIIDMTSYRSSGACLRITNNGIGNYGLYTDVRLNAETTRRWMMLVGWIKFLSRATGSAGLHVRFRDTHGSFLASADLPPLLTEAKDYTQHGGLIAVPAGASEARIYCWTEALDGTVVFDDVALWFV